MNAPCRSLLMFAALGVSLLMVTRQALAQAAPPGPAADPPITLHYRESPILLAPHANSVTAVAFAPDGKTVATGSDDGYLRLWEAATGRLQWMSGEDATRGIQAIAFSPDGRRLAAVGAFFGSECVLVDAATGRIERHIADPLDPAAQNPAQGATPFLYKGKPIVFRVLTAVAFSPDGKILATAPDGVVLRDAQSGDIIARLKEPAPGVKALAFSPDGQTLATAALDRKVRLWSVPGGALAATLAGPTQPLTAVAFSPDGKRIVAAASGNCSLIDSTPAGSLWSWELPGGPARKIDLGQVAVRQIAFAGPETVLVGAGRQVLSIDLARESQSARKLWSHSQDVLALAVSPDRRFVASGSADRTADLVELATGKLVQRLPGQTDGISSVAASSDGRAFATATIDLRFSHHVPTSAPSFAARYKNYFGEDANAGRLEPSEVRVGSTADGRLATLLALPSCQVTALRFIPKTRQLAVAGWIPDRNGLLSLWDTTTGQHLRDFAVGSAEVLSIAVSPDGRTLASGDADGSLDLWDVQSAAKTKSHKHDRAVEAVAFSADGKLLATGDDSRAVRLFDATTLALARTLQSRARLKSLDFSPDANLLAAGTRVPGLELWDLRTDQESRTLKSPGDRFETDESRAGFVAFSPDGRFVVCGGKGKDIAVFETAGGQLVTELRGHFHPATAAAFLPDGRLVSGGIERTVRLWDPTKSALLATWIAVPADPAQHWSDEWVGYAPSGRFVGSPRLARLIGWHSGGEVILSPEDPTRRRVDSLFSAKR